MSFATGYKADPDKVQGGEIFDSATVISFTDFENGLKVGRFAKFDSGSIDNVDGSATPEIAGVVKRNATNPIEDGDTIDNTLFEKVDVMISGTMTVDVKPGETPAPYGAVFVSNAGDANDGLAMTSAGEATSAIFLEEVTTDVWLIALRIK